MSMCRCSECERAFDLDFGGTLTDKVALCDNCMDRFSICDGCGDYFPYKEVYEVGDELLCDECHYFEVNCKGDLHKYYGVHPSDFI